MSSTGSAAQRDWQGRSEQVSWSDWPLPVTSKPCGPAAVNVYQDNTTSRLQGLAEPASHLFTSSFLTARPPWLDGGLTTVTVTYNST